MLKIRLSLSMKIFYSTLIKYDISNDNLCEFVLLFEEIDWRYKQFEPTQLNSNFLNYIQDIFRLLLIFINKELSKALLSMKFSTKEQISEFLNTRKEILSEMRKIIQDLLMKNEVFVQTDDEESTKMIDFLFSSNLKL